MKMNMPAAHQEITVETELERIERWRADELMRAGYEAEQAMALAVRLDVDLHRAAELIKNGCSPALALQILL
jgi:hypothetical protein